MTFEPLCSEKNFALHLDRKAQWEHVARSYLPDDLVVPILRSTMGAFGHCEKILRRIKSHQTMDLNLTDAEAICLLNYTSNGAYLINSSLSYHPLTNQDYYLWSQLIVRALGKLPRHSGMVWRKQDTSIEEAAVFRHGKYIFTHGFLSASASPEAIPSGRDIIRIKSQTGALLGPYSLIDHEQEVLFLPETVFRVNKVKQRKEGRTIDLEEVECVHQSQSAFSKLCRSEWNPLYGCFETIQGLARWRLGSFRRRP